MHARGLLSFQQPLVKTQTQNNSCDVFELCMYLFVSSALMKCRLLKCLLDHPMKRVCPVRFGRVPSRRFAVSLQHQPTKSEPQPQLEPQITSSETCKLH